MQLYTAAQELCAEEPAPPTSAACRGCSAQTYDPDKVTVQALQGNCADPLGTRRGLCRREAGTAGPRRGWRAGGRILCCCAALILR